MSAADFNVVGTSFTNPDAFAKVTGRTEYAGDLRLPRMLHAKIRRSEVPHARIRRIDTWRAAALPGVVAVVTAADLPDVRYGILPVSQDEEALCRDKVRMVGDPVAAVAAVDEATAEEALGLIEVEYDPLPALFSVAQALEQQDVRIHDYGHGPNVHRAVSFAFGEVDLAFAGADRAYEDTFFYEGSTHLPLETHAALADWTPGGLLTLWSSTQTPHYVHRAVARALAVPASRVRVVATPVGGGFGGKTDPFSHEIVACRLAQMTGRPVRIALSRQEVFYCHRGRHPALMAVRTGWSAAGDLLALEFRCYLDGGAYGSYGAASLLYTGALLPVTYRVGAYRFEGVRVFTNKPPCGPKRGHGTPQGRFALECHLDKVALAGGTDPVALRERILAEPYTRTANQLTITTTALRTCLERVVAESGYPERLNLPAGHGLGVACSAYMSGAGLAIYRNDLPHSGAVVKIDRSGAVAVFCGATDIGQGSNAILAALAAEVLGVDMCSVRVYSADTDLTPVDLGSYSSRVTLMAGNAVLRAAQDLRDRVGAAVAAHLGCLADDLVFAGGRVIDRLDPERGVSFEEAATIAEARCGTLAAAGSYRPPERAGSYKGSGVGPSPCYSYSACAAEVRVDPETGQIVPLRIWLAHDAGRALNTAQARGQIEGSVYMGLGEALMEAHVVTDGLPQAVSMLDYKSPTALDMPEVFAYLVGEPDPEGPFGAKEVGQGPLLPVAPAIANAVRAALGIHIDEVPMTPDRVLLALSRRARGDVPRVGPTTLPNYAFPSPRMVESLQGRPADRGGPEARR